MVHDFQKSIIEDGETLEGPPTPILTQLKEYVLMVVATLGRWTGCSAGNWV